MSRPTQNLARRAPARRGMVLPLVLMALAVALVLGTTFLTSASTSTQLATGADHRLRARLIAESGLTMTLAYVESDHNWRTDRANGVWVTSQAHDGGTFTVSGEDGDRVDATGAVVGDTSLVDDPRDPLTITCVGIYGGARHVARAVRTPPQAYGIVVNERVELKRQAFVDSYNPNIGPYSVATATQRAVARANGLARQPYILMSGSARVNGNVYFGPGGTVARSMDIRNSAVITGTKLPLPAAVATTEIVDPGWLPDGAGVTTSYSSGTTNLSSDLWTDGLTLSGGAILRAVGDVKVYVDGDLNVTDTARIVVGAPAPFAATVRTTVQVQAGTRVDAYDSSAGMYGGANVLTEGPLLATNQTTANSISVAGTVNGDTLAGPLSVPQTAITTSGTGSINGGRRAMFEALTIPAPAAPPTLTAGLDIEPAAGIPHTILLDAQVARFRVNSGAKVIVSGNRRIRVTDEFRIDGGEIEILPNSSLTLYVANAMRIEGSGARLNVTPNAMGYVDPSKLVIHSNATSAVEHAIAGNAVVHALIDAPNANLALDDTAQLFGAFMGNALALRGASQLHLDRNPLASVANGSRMSIGFAPGKLTIYVHNKVTIQRTAKLNVNTVDPARLVINHFGGEPMEVKESAIVYARAFVPEMTLAISGTTTRWTGRIEARDFNVSGSAVVTADDTGGTARPGIIIEETINLKDTAVINGTGGTALLASHGATDTTVWIKDQSNYRGDAYTAPGGNADDEIRTTHSAVFAGVKRAQAVPAPVTALAAPAVVGTVSDRTISGTSNVTITGDLFYRKFEVKDNAIVNVDGVTRLILTGDFRLSSNARIVLKPNATLTVHCAGYPWILGSGSSTSAPSPQVNVGGHPGRFTLSCPNAYLVYLGNASKVCGTILAPKAIFYLSDSCEVFGGVTGRRITIDRYAKLHCAESLPGPVTWIEQQ